MELREQGEQSHSMMVKLTSSKVPIDPTQHCAIFDFGFFSVDLRK